MQQVPPDGTKRIPARDYIFRRNQRWRDDRNLQMLWFLIREDPRKFAASFTPPE